MRRLCILVSSILMLFPLLADAQVAKGGFNEKAVPDYYLQYVPIVADMGLDWLGVEAEHSTVDRIMAAGIGFMSEVIIVNGIKYTVKEERPDGSARNSFPSGHSATAFLGAELVRHEYGWGWGAGAYAVATSVAALRVYHHRHYWWDTVAGAGCGILSANIGYWLLKPTRKLLGMDADISPMYDPVTGAYGTQLSLRF